MNAASDELVDSVGYEWEAPHLGWQRCERCGNVHIVRRVGNVLKCKMCHADDMEVRR